MAKRRSIKPEASLRLAINGHQLTAEKWSGKWAVVVCPSWPDLATRHAGCEDASELIEAFTRRATGGGSGPQAEAS